MSVARERWGWRNSERQEEGKIIGKETTHKEIIIQISVARERWGWRNTEIQEEGKIIKKETTHKEYIHTNINSKRDGDGGIQKDRKRER